MGRARQLTRLGRDRVLAVIKAAPSQAAAARELGVHESTVSRWAKRHGGPRRAPARPQETRTGAAEGAVAALPTDAASWARGVREAYALDDTEGAALLLAEQMLAVALDAGRPVSERVGAVKAWQSLVKQLNLEADDRGEAAPAYPRLA
jgi:hypothetical protein